MIERRGDTLSRLLTTTVNTGAVLAILVYAAVFADGRVALERGSVSHQVGDLITFALACGAAAFATIEILKRLFGLRGLYQRRQTERWLEERADMHETDGHAFEELTWAMGINASHGEVARTFNLPAELLVAQIGNAAELALASGRHQSLIETLAGTDRSPEPSDAEDELADTAQRLRAAVDQLQISLTERWRRYVQGAALWIAGLFGIGLLDTHNPDRPRFVLAAVLVGGPFAWLIRDLVATIERARR